MAAIDLITRQGEGSEDNPEDSGPDDLSHYYRFLEIKKNRYIQKNGSDGYRYSDEPIENLDGDGTYLVQEVPKGGYNESNVPDSDKDILPLMEEFNQGYTKMLKLLEKAWNEGQTTYLIEAIMTMFSLSGSLRYGKGPAYKIIETPITSEKQIIQHYGPSFIVVDGVDVPEITDAGDDTLVWDDIKELFKEGDRKEMEKRGMHLDDYEEVRKNADRILYQVNAHKMPAKPWPEGGNDQKTWDDETIAKFRRWVELGMPETEADLSEKRGQINRPQG